MEKSTADMDKLVGGLETAVQAVPQLRSVFEAQHDNAGHIQAYHDAALELAGAAPQALAPRGYQGGRRRHGGAAQPGAPGQDVVTHLRLCGGLGREGREAAPVRGGAANTMTCVRNRASKLQNVQ